MLRPCPACRRHVAAAATTCAFCATSLVAVARREPHLVGRVGRAAVFASAVAIAPLGCGARSPTYERLTETSGQAITTGEVRGVIRDHRGQPAQTHVALHGVGLRRHPASGGLDQIVVQTSDDGRFVLEDLPPGDYRMTITNDGGERAVTVRAGHATVLTLELPAPPAFDHRHMAKPYGAPPARHRVV